MCVRALVLLSTTLTSDGGTKAWEEQVPNQGFLLFLGLRNNKPLCTCRAFSIFVLLGNHEGM